MQWLPKSDRVCRDQIDYAVRIICRNLPVAIAFCASACSSGSSSAKTANSTQGDAPASSAGSTAESSDQSQRPFHADPWQTAAANGTGRGTGDVRANLPPEAVLVEFLMAVVAKDSGKLKSFSLPDPELSILWQGKSDAAPPEVLAEMRDYLDGQIIRLQVGDTVKLQTGGNLVIDDQSIGDNRVMLLATFPGEEAFPFTLLKAQGAWKVDAVPLIAARKAAVAVQERRDSNSRR